MRSGVGYDECMTSIHHPDPAMHPHIEYLAASDILLCDACALEYFYATDDSDAKSDAERIHRMRRQIIDFLDIDSLT
jgi:hypothetical protein